MKTSQAAAIALGRAFGETVDPEGHVPRPASESRLDALAAWCRSDGAGSTVAALVAPPGIGKTHLLRVLESRLREDERARPGESGGSGEETPGSPSVRPRCRALYLPYAALTLPDLARWIQGLVGGRWPLRVATADPDEDALRALAGLAAGPRRPLHLLIDDADSMPTSTLRALVQAPDAGAAPHTSFSPRETQVFELLLAGRSVNEIAQTLEISGSTASNHLARVRDKLGASTNAEVLIYAHRAGLLA